MTLAAATTEVGIVPSMSGRGVIGNPFRARPEHCSPAAVRGALDVTDRQLDHGEQGDALLSRFRGLRLARRDGTRTPRHEFEAATMRLAPYREKTTMVKHS